MKTASSTYDFIGIGIGPFNLGLACLTDPIKELKGIFLDKNDVFNWHPGMLLEHTTLQIPFMADLVTFADPTNRFSFLNYLKEEGKFYAFYVRKNFLILRNEYNNYCRWIIKQLKTTHFGTAVKSLQYDAEKACYVLTALSIKNNILKQYCARKLVIAVGTVPDWPVCCEHIKNKLIHSSGYLFNKQHLQLKKSITIIGSGQSAAEIFYELLQEIELYNYKLNWYTRSPHFFPMDFSKLTAEMTSPDYINYFYSLSDHKKESILKTQASLFKGINIQLISKIYDLLYTKNLLHAISIEMQTNSSLEKIAYDKANDRFAMKFYQHEEEKYFEHTAEGVVIASGYSTQIPEFLNGIRERICFNEKGAYRVNENYSIDKNGNEIFVQNAEMHTHGFTSFGLDVGCIRNATIINALTEKEHYVNHHNNTFQQFRGKMNKQQILMDTNN